MSKEHLRQGHLTLFESHNNLRILSLNISRPGTCWPSTGLYKAWLASGTLSYLISYSSKFIIPPFILHFPSTPESTFVFTQVHWLSHSLSFPLSLVCVDQTKLRVSDLSLHLYYNWLGQHHAAFETMLEMQEKYSVTPHVVLLLLSFPQRLC